MSWFDEQLRYRNEMDDDSLADSLDSIAGAIMGRRLTEAMSEREIAGSAIEEILKFFHFKAKNDDLPNSIKTIDDQLDYRLRPFGIARRTVALDKGWYKSAVGPLLGTLKADGSLVALIPDKFAGYSYLNISTGERVRLNRRTEKLLDSEAICFYKPLPRRAITMGDLLMFMKDQLTVSDIVVYIGMMVLTTLLGLLSPMFTKWLFGNVLESGSTRVLLALASFLLCYSICQLCMAAFQSLISARFGIKMNIAVQAAVMNRVMSLPAAFFRDFSSGELTQRSMYIQSLCSTLLTTIGSTGFTSLFSLIYIGQIFAYAPALVVPSIAITVITVVVSLATAYAQTKITREQMLMSSQARGMSYSMITGIQKIKLAGAEKRMFARWARDYAQEAKLTYNPPTFLKLSGTISTAISLTGVLILYFTAIKSNVSISDYYAFNSAYAMVSGAFMSFAGIAVTLAHIKPTLDMARPILEAEPELSDGLETVTSLRGAIELNNVSFRYKEGEQLVIDDLSLKIRAGEYVAIVGSTGCGKSTLMRLLLGFETPQRGAIYYDGKDLSRLDVRSLRQNVGVVTQDGKLFLGDIYSNIVISAPQLSLDEAWEAARIASIDQDIRNMPMGMNTIISEGQGGISGGQRQRLMIARAVAPKPKILMFDEATSALDNLTQKKVSEAVDSLHCTRIVIAHRLSTIRHCDRIIVLDKGKIVEDGTYDELIANNALFSELVARQRLDTEEAV